MSCSMCLMSWKQKRKVMKYVGKENVCYDGFTWKKRRCLCCYIVVMKMIIIMKMMVMNFMKESDRKIC